jgi:hypothetical protein
VKISEAMKASDAMSVAELGALSQTATAAKKIAEARARRPM